MSSPLPFRRTARFLLPATTLLTVLFLLSHFSNRSITETPAPPQTLPVDHHSKPNIKFHPPTPSIQHSVIRGDGVVLTGGDSPTKAKMTEWHSVGRPPNRAECWTYQDRYGVYKNLTTEMTSLISKNNKNHSRNKRAILIRTGEGQQWGEQFTLHIRSMVLEAGYLGEWDVVIYAHLDTEEKKTSWLKRVPPELQPLVHIFTTQQLKQWTPKETTFKNVYEHNHIPVQLFMSQNTHYDFVYTIEHDVRLIGRWDHFLSDVQAEYSFHRSLQDADQSLPAIPDLVTFQALQHPPADWVWLKSETRCVDHFGGRNKTRSSLGVVWGWSRRLTDALTDYNKQGINCYFEYFAPSVAARENLTTFFYQHPLYCPNRGSPSERYSLPVGDLAKNDPRRVQWGRVAVGCTYYFVDTHSEPFWKTWYEDEKSCRPPALVHPVKDRFFS